MVFEDAFRHMLRDEMRAVVREEVREALRVESTKDPGGSDAGGHDEYLSTADAAKYAHLSGKTIRCWIAAGKLRGYRAGRLLRIKRSELDLLMGAPAPTTTEQVDDIAQRILKGG